MVGVEKVSLLGSLVEQYNSKGILPDGFKSLIKTDLGDITEEGLSKEVVSLLKKTDEGSVSAPVLINGQYNLFFVRRKDLVESDLFLKNKERIEKELFEEELRKVLADWIEREKAKLLVKFFF
ncbi:MAG: hypothetical protein HQK53_17370, partial [Oligoflexia bacterium]|nr:hypothetical protein [Oligoflexia bacterium]